jgi:hypothetical protein
MSTSSRQLGVSRMVPRVTSYQIAISSELPIELPTGGRGRTERNPARQSHPRNRQVTRVIASPANEPPVLAQLRKLRSDLDKIITDLEDDAA